MPLGKSFLSVLLAISFFLPFFSKTYYIHENDWRYSESVGEVVMKNGSNYKKVINETYPIREVSKRIESIAIFIFPFFWPVLIIFFYFKAKSNRLLLALKFIELIFLGVTAFVVSMFIFAGQIDFSGSAQFELGVGAYFAVTFLVGYGAIFIFEISKGLKYLYNRYFTGG